MEHRRSGTLNELVYSKIDNILSKMGKLTFYYRFFLAYRTVQMYVLNVQSEISFQSVVLHYELFGSLCCCTEKYFWKIERTNKVNRKKKERKNQSQLNHNVSLLSRPAFCNQFTFCLVLILYVHCFTRFNLKYFLNPIIHCTYQTERIFTLMFKTCELCIGNFFCYQRIEIV